MVCYSTLGCDSRLTSSRPFIINNILFIVLELGTGFTQNYSSFLAVRALFGIAMGGLYGNAAATALEDCPDEARGLVSAALKSSQSPADEQDVRYASTRVCFWIPACYGFCSWLSKHHFAWVAPALLVRRVPTRSHHPLPPLPA